jgi:hypothetical protein
MMSGLQAYISGKTHVNDEWFEGVCFQFSHVSRIKRVIEPTIDDVAQRSQLNLYTKQNNVLGR